MLIGLFRPHDSGAPSLQAEKEEASVYDTSRDHVFPALPVFVVFSVSVQLAPVHDILFHSCVMYSSRSGHGVGVGEREGETFSDLTHRAISISSAEGESLSPGKCTITATCVYLEFQK